MANSRQPINAGSLRPLRVALPEGTVVSAIKPAAMRLWMTYPMTVVDAIFRALADVVPGAAIAGHHADLGMTHTYGVDEWTGRFFQFYGGPQGGGWGATSDADGQNATMCINDGDTHNSPVEVVEAKYPMVTITEYALREDSGGPGRFRGGLGTRLKIRMHTPAKMDTWIERTACAPWGLAGGHDAAANQIWIERADGEQLRFTSGKVTGIELAEGDSHVVELGGGGGFGDPRRRPAREVLADVTAGYVSVEAACDVYGVAVDTTSEGHFVLNELTTQRLRADAHD